MKENDIPVYDEDEAVKFIRQAIPTDVASEYTDDDILFIIDSIWDYYESAGMTSLDNIETDAEEADMKAVTAYVEKALKSDGHILMTDANISMIVKAELQYEKTLEDFSD